MAASKGFRPQRMTSPGSADSFGAADCRRERHAVFDFRNPRTVGRKPSAGADGPDGAGTVCLPNHRAAGTGAFHGFQTHVHSAAGAPGQRPPEGPLDVLPCGNGQRLGRNSPGPRLGPGIPGRHGPHRKRHPTPRRKPESPPQKSAAGPGPVPKAPDLPAGLPFHPFPRLPYRRRGRVHDRYIFSPDGAADRCDRTHAPPESGTEDIPTTPFPPFAGILISRRVFHVVFIAVSATIVQAFRLLAGLDCRPQQDQT